MFRTTLKAIAATTLLYSDPALATDSATEAKAFSTMQINT
jgi:hypothetical protein